MPLICRDFERLCQTALDRRQIDGAGLGAVLDEHAAACSGCQPIYNRYLYLRHAIQALPAPVPAEDCLDRTLRAVSRQRPTTLRFSKPARIALALAASFLVAGLVAIRGLSGSKPGRSAVVARVETPRPLGDALSDATIETLGLARKAAAPTARVGRDVFRSASLPSVSWGLALSTDSATEALQSVGDEVESGVRPLSGSARSAFGFLIPGQSRSSNSDRAAASKTSKGT